jgi:hypothetical protein
VVDHRGFATGERCRGIAPHAATHRANSIPTLIGRHTKLGDIFDGGQSLWGVEMNNGRIVIDHRLAIGSGIALIQPDREATRDRKQETRAIRGGQLLGGGEKLFIVGGDFDTFFFQQIRIVVEDGGAALEGDRPDIAFFIACIFEQRLIEILDKGSTIRSRVDELLGWDD